MRKTLLSLLIAALLVCVFSTVAMAVEPEASGCASGNHSWSKYTPDGDGKHTRVCQAGCGTYQTVECTWINYPNGKYAVQDGQATCAHGTLYYKSCSECGVSSSETFEANDKLGHNLNGWYTEDENYLATPATCISQATYYWHCQYCGEKGDATIELGEMLDHTYNGEIRKTSSKKSHRVYCSTDGCTASTSVEHQTKDEITPSVNGPICTVGTTTTWNCVCGYEVAKETVQVSAHNKKEVADEGYLKTAATCYSDAVYYTYCDICEKHAGPINKGGYNNSKDIWTDEGSKNEVAHTPQKLAIEKYAVPGGDATCLHGKEYFESCSVAKCGAALSTTFYEGLPCEHEPGEYVYDDNAKCGVDGTETAKCANGDCGTTWIRTAKNTALKHVFNEEDYVLDGTADCENATTKTAKCANGCGATDTKDVSNIGHDWTGEVVFEWGDPDSKGIPTSGNLVTYCRNNCGKSMLLASDNTIVKGTTTPATCQKGAVTMYLASITYGGKTWDEAYPLEGSKKVACKADPTWVKVKKEHYQICQWCSTKMNAAAHTPVKSEAESYAATCTKKGKLVEYCSTCGYKTTNKNLDPLGHTDGAWVITTKPTCLVDGLQEKFCTVCGEKRGEKVIAKLGHWFEPMEYAKPSCTGDGVSAEKCTRCGLIVAKEAVDATGHKPGEWTVTKEATCTEKGQKVQKCSVCDVIVGTEEIAVIAHKAGEFTVTKEATCTDKGEKVQKCTVCSAVLATEAIDALGHKWGEWVVTTPATYEAAGVETKTCTVCKETDTRAIAKLEPTAAPTVEPTAAPTDVPTTEPTDEPTVAPTEEPEQPADPENPDTGDTTVDGDVEIPKTGDNSTRTAAYVMMAMTIAGLALLAITKRKASAK